MSLHWSAITMASHICIIAAVVILLANAGVAIIRAGTVTLTVPVQIGVCGIASAIIVERAYYVAARVLVNSEIDLWESHPAPELLSILVWLSIMGCAGAILSSFARGWVFARWFGGELAATICFFVMISWTMW